MVSLEAADRPNFFLHVTANGSLELAKWQAGDAFRHHASFSLHRGTWRAGLVALESLAEPGAFLYVSGPVLALRPYEHTEAFRRGTLFRLLGRCLPCLTLPAFSPPHPSHCPLRDKTLTLLLQRGHTVTPLRWEGAWPPCWWPREPWAVWLGAQPASWVCLLLQAIYMV